MFEELDLCLKFIADRLGNYVPSIWLVVVEFTVMPIYIKLSDVILYMFKYFFAID